MKETSDLTTEHVLEGCNTPVETSLAHIVDVLRANGQVVIDAPGDDQPTIIAHVISGGTHDLEGFPHEDAILHVTVLPPGTDVAEFERRHG